MEDKRDYLRVPFHCVSQINVVDQSYPSELLDISLRGVLLEVNPPPEIGLGSLCGIDISFASCNTHLQLDAKLVHREGNHYGFLIESLDLDSLTHLRRLLELNYGDSEKIDREFFHWLHADE